MATQKPEMLLKIRQQTVARRLYKCRPLFAYYELMQLYPGYTYEQYLTDIKPRPTGKKLRRRKNVKVKYGRYRRVQQLLTQWHTSHDYDALITASNLYKHLRKPYYVKVRIGNQHLSFTYPATVGVNIIEELVSLYHQCHEIADAIAIHDLCRQRYGFGYEVHC
ncbi:hypothetical protein [Chitinophaga arvensicola]|uniref:Uncharacterized protein n=1 Tax=Chitinophaga arvensicola TaxID=29529 RepID=A0A1I0PQ79_9BACT|nr:hypothetical protein [Chitinophaga arvensicola]SEW16527.1 hypothetical protein SAMN04488122_0910 [Chitinophaga arvensicola]